MGKRKPWLNLTLIGGYFVLAVLILVFLISMATSGSVFGRTTGAYSAEVTRAPGLIKNKSSVVNPAGVSIGVVTGVTLVNDGAVVDFKLTTPFNVYEDATAQTITKTILGEKALVLDPGTRAAGRAENGSSLAAPALPLPVEPSDSLDPLAASLGKLTGLDASSMLADLRQNLVPILGELDSTMADVNQIATAIGSTDGALQRVGERTTALLKTLAARETDIVSIVTSLGVLTAEVSEIVNTNVGQINDILVVTGQLTGILAAHDAEINAALAALPGMLDQLTNILENTIAAFNGEQGHVFVANLDNMLTVGQMIAILKGGR